MDNTDDAEYSNSQLANILSNVYQDVDNLRRELSLAKKRADKAERLLQSFQTIQQSSADVSSSSGQSPDVARLIMDYEDRLSRAERAREDAEARKRAIQEHWPSVERYLTLIERKAHDTRSSFSRVVSEDTSPISLPHLTSYSVNIPFFLPLSIHSQQLTVTTTRTPTYSQPSRHIPTPIPDAGTGPRAWTRRYNNRPPSDQEAKAMIATAAILTMYVSKSSFCSIIDPSSFCSSIHPILLLIPMKTIAPAANLA